MQHLMGIEGVIVDLVQEIAEAVSDMIKPTTAKDGETRICWKETGRCRCRMLGYFKEIDSPPPVMTNSEIRAACIQKTETALQKMETAMQKTESAMQKTET